MEKPLVNRIAESGIITFNLEEYFPQQEIVTIDLKDYLFQGLILREKEFRQTLKDTDWSKHAEKIVCVYCSTDAIIPVWAYMLLATYVSPVAYRFFVGTKEEFLKAHYYDTLSQLDPLAYEHGRIVIKGCSNKPVPPAAYAYLTEILRPVAKSVMYGEPCSTVPIYKRPLKRVR